MSLIIKNVRQAALYGPEGFVENSPVTEKMADHVNDLFGDGGASIALGNVQIAAGELFEALQLADSSECLTRFGRRLSAADVKALSTVLHAMLDNQVDVLV